jgi:SAM-dependent methyltransferase
VSKWPERIDPEATPAGVVAHHLKKYDFALSHVRGFTLDVACGVGYGSAYLVSAAARVVGVDIDLGALGMARSRYGSECHFIRADASALPLADESADTVVCFEGIEHFADPAKHLREVIRVLKQDGSYLVSTPRKGVHARPEENPYHLHAFDEPAFRYILLRHFDSVTLLGQRRLQSRAYQLAQRADLAGARRLRLARPLARWASRTLLGTPPTEEATMLDFVIDDQMGAATEFVAICRLPRKSARVSAGQRS